MKKSSIQFVSPIVAVSALLLTPGCLQQTDDIGAEDPVVYEGESAQGTFQLRNEGTGKCVRRSTSLEVGNGYEVHQASCSSAPSAEQLWRQECGSNGCRYVSGAYCLKASSTVKASGGSYDVYVAACSDDRDQRWDGFRSRDTGRCMYASQSEHTSDGSAQVVQRDCDTTAKFRFTQLPAGGPPLPPNSPNPFCQGGSNGENADQRTTGSLSYNNRSVSYEMRGGVIKTKHSPNACVSTTVSQGQTQIVALGTSDGGCSSCKVNEPVDRALMQNQGFSLVRAVGDQDARSEVWARVFDSTKSAHRSTIAISGDSNAVAWVIANVGASLSTSALAGNAVSTGSGKSIKDSRVSMSGYQSSQYQFKFLAAFLDDTCAVDEEDEDRHMLSFWRQGDGDTFIVGMWGAGESAKSGIRVTPLEDTGFDVAIIATGANP